MRLIVRILGHFLRAILILTAPFFLFVRSAVYIHTEYQYHATFSILASGLVLALILFVYLTIGYRIFFKRIGDGKALKNRLIFILLLSFGILVHLLFFISSKHGKTSDIKSEFSELHPILRLATGIFTKLDKNLVVTDISRSAEDYDNMGLRENKRSLHYPQKDGYAYAIDLRTKGKSHLNNSLLTWYYKILGFETLRHVGTADHLHVALYCPPKYRR